MHVSQDEAKLIAGYTLGEYERERETTRRVLAAVPFGQEAYAPDPRSTPALQLAWHIASSEWFFLKAVADGAFPKGEPGVPESIRSAADVLAWYEASVPEALEAAKAVSAEALTRTISMTEQFALPGVAWLSLMVRHSVHHRGQLSAYLRPMGAKVPSIYGPSGDTK